MILARKAVRDVRGLGVRAVLLVLVVGVGVGTGVGIGLALRQVQATRDGFYREYGLADLDVRLARPLPAAVLRARAGEAGASSAEVRLVVDGAARLADGRALPAEVVGMAPRARLDRLALLSGEPLSAAAPRGALVEADFARSAHVRVGDRIGLVLGGRQLTVRVRGLARSPEYLLATASPEYLVPARGSLAVLFLPRAGLQRLLGWNDAANDLAADFPSGTPVARERSLAAGLPVARLTPRSQQFSLLLTDADIRSFALFEPLVAAIFALVGLVLIALSLRRLVHAQRRELGALLALGYSRRTVVASATAPAALLALPGAAVAALSCIGVGRLVAGEYAAAVGFPHVDATLSAGPVLVAAGSALAATLLAALAPAWALARLRPSEAMRGEAAAALALPGWLVRASALGPSGAYAVRSLLRRLPLRLATVVSLAAAIGLGTALQILATSTNSAVDAALAGQQWAYSVDLTQPLPVETALALAHARGASSAEPVLRSSARLEAAAGRAQDVQLVGLPAGATLERLQLAAGNPPAPGRIVLAEQLAGRLHVRIGDSIAVRTAAGRSARVVVTGIARTLANDAGFLPLEQAARLAGFSGRASGLLVAASPRTAERLRGAPDVARVTSKESIRKGMHDLVGELTTLIDVLIGLSLGVGALFLVASLALAQLGREGEFATLRALGYGRRAIASIIALEALVQTLGAAILSIPLSLAIAWPLERRIGSAWFHIGLTARPSDFVLAIGLAFALSLLVALHIARRTLRLDIAATVRARLIG